ncbi:MAG: S8 family serine peptidase [Candidatus Tumulicola sp.]
MSRNFIRATAFFAIASLTACHGGAMGNGVVPQTPSSAQSSTLAQTAFGGSPPVTVNGEIPLTSRDAVREVCPRPSRAGEMRCFALERVDLRSNDAQENATHYGYGPKDLQNAYKITVGNGTKVAIVDAYGYPRASSDLAAYRSSYALGACTTGNGCLTIRNQTGGTSPPPTNVNWDAEQAVDLDMVSAICPKCHIVLVQANTDYTSDLYTAVKEAVKLGAVVISNSYGGSEYSQCGGPGEPSDPAFAATGHVYVASSGDDGGGLKNCGGPQQPCSLAPVVCVGGTHLVTSNDQRGWKESVWNEIKDFDCSGSCGGAGSGCSIDVKKPTWQNDGLCKMRSESDVAAEASVLTPVAVYFNGWTAFGGTSVSAPLIAGIFGRAGNAAGINGPEHVWANRTKLFDPTVGSNLYAPIGGNCASSVHYICYARSGFDGPTGLGTPNGLGAF